MWVFPSGHIPFLIKSGEWALFAGRHTVPNGVGTESSRFFRPGDSTGRTHGRQGGFPRLSHDGLRSTSLERKEVNLNGKAMRRAILIFTINIVKNENLVVLFPSENCEVL